MYRTTPIAYRILDSLFRYRALFLLSVFVVTVLPLAFLLTRKPQYTATAATQCTEDANPQLNHLVNTDREFSWITVAQKNMTRFNEWVSDDRPGGFLETALKSASLKVPINIDPRARDPRLATLRKGLHTATESDTIFSINLIWDNPQECPR